MYCKTLHKISAILCTIFLQNTAVYAPNKLLSKNKRLFEQKVNNELNRMIKNPVTMIFSKLLSIFKGLIALVLLLASLFFGSIVVDEYKVSSLKLPTINPDIELNLGINIEDEFKQLFTGFFSKNKMQNFDFPNIKNEDIVPFYPTLDYPSTVTNAEQLGQAIASNMANFQNQFTIYYQGYAANFNNDLKNAYIWLDQNEPYLWGIRGESYIQVIDYNSSYIAFQTTMNYDLTIEQNALVYGKIKQLIRNLDSNLTEAEKVKFVNDYLVTHTKYNDQSNAHPHTPYAILIHGEGVCEGYALAAHLMLEELGIENKYVVGDAGGPHAWNLVKVDNNWYHLDVTWNDPIPDQGKKLDMIIF